MIFLMLAVLLVFWSTILRPSKWVVTLADVDFLRFAVQSDNINFTLRICGVFGWFGRNHILGNIVDTTRPVVHLEFS